MSTEVFHGNFRAGEVWSIAVGPMANNVYLIVDSERVGYLVDAAAEPELITSFVERHCDSLDAIVTTHQHADHLGALTALAERAESCWAGAPDARAITETTGIAQIPAWSGDHLLTADDACPLIGLSGHTPGGLAIDVGGALIVGDSLFPGGVGKTDSPENFVTLFGDVTTKLFLPYPDNTVVLPGHGNPTTLADERPHLPEWRKRGW